MTSTARSYAAQDAIQKGKKRSRVRRFVTPEGVDLSLEIASSGLRLAALIIDLMLIGAILLVFGLLAIFLVFGENGGTVSILFLLGFFLIRNFWFTMFELGPRAATPGKRMIGIRVVARDGGRLNAPAVIARNLVREVEMFLPLQIMFSSGEDGPLGLGLFGLGLLWVLGLSLFLMFNKDRMRLGDLIGGTWVVMARRSKIVRDLADNSAAPQETVHFTRAELSVYGVFELQALEKVLRENNQANKISVVDAIRTKLGRTLQESDDDFLEAYYRQAKAQMERDLLFGKRRANKYEANP